MQILESTRNEAVEELKDLVRIPSESSSPEHHPDIGRSTEWLRKKLISSGAHHVELLETKGNPVLYGDWIHSPALPTVLVYGHYDVQPADPLDKWETPPYEPVLRNGRLYGRGTADDKSGIIAALAALKAFRSAGEAPSVNLKFCFEGEEEIGSPNLPDLMTQERKRFAADLVLSVDGGQWSETQPQMVTGYRGIAVLEVRLAGPDKDLHSGLLGGAVTNPAEALARLIATMRHPDGTIAIEGFYADVVDSTEEERAAIQAIPGTDRAVAAAAAGAVLAGEAGYSAIERTWIRPTLDINGIWGGHAGPGPKTIIPAQAGCKISCRLVADQEPDRIIDLVSRHIRKHTPESVSLDLIVEPSRAWPYAIRPDHPAKGVLSGVLEEVFGCRPYETRIGGSLPVTQIFSKVLETDTISLGCSNPESNLHAPNEFVSLELLDRTARCVLLLLQRLGPALA